MKKKILSVLLSLAMLGSLIVLPTGALAAEDYSDYSTWEVTALNRVKSAHGYHLGDRYGNGCGSKHPHEQPSGGWAIYNYDETKLTNGGVGINGTQIAKNNLGFGSTQNQIDKYYNWVQYKPNTNYAVSFKFRNMSDGNVTPTFYVGMLSHDGSSFEKVQYEKVMITETSAAGQVYTNTFTTGATAIGITGVYLGFGTAETVLGYTTEKTATGSVVGAMGNEVYIGEEQVKEITNETEESKTISSGDSIVATSQVLNQVGDTGLLDQTISFKVLNAERTEEVLDSGVTVTPGVNGKYTISVADDAKVGEYVILAKSALSEEGKLLQKGLDIKVINPYAPVEYEEFVAKDDSEKPLNMLANPEAADHYTGRYGALADVSWLEGHTIEQYKWQDNVNLYPAMGINGPQLPNTGAAGPKYNWTEFKANTGYIVGLKLKNASPEGVTPLFGIVLRSKDGDGNESRDVYYEEITEREGWQDFTANVYSKYNGTEASKVVIGYPVEGTVDGKDIPDAVQNSNVHMLIAESYIVEEVLWDAIVETEDDIEVISAGEEFKAEAAVLNQIGKAGTLKQNFRWYLLDPETNKPVKGATVTADAKDSSKVTVSLKDTVEPGEYILLAQSENYDCDRTKAITVIEPIIKDSPVGTNPLYEVKVSIKGEGDADMGLFDSIVLKAEMVDSTGNVGTNVQEFSWISTIENRIYEEPKVKLEISQDTTEATVKFAPSIESGTYYVIAESKADESLGMRKGFKITVDKSTAVKEMGEKFDTTSAEGIKNIEENLDVYLEVLKLNDANDFANKADKADLAKVIAASAKGETLETEEEVAKFVEKAAVVSLYNKNTNNVSLQAIDGNFEFAEELEIEDIDKDDVTLYKNFRTIMSDEGRKAMQKELAKPSTPYASYDDFIAAVKEKALLYAIGYPEEYGTGYMEDVMTDENIAAAGFSGGEYTGLKDKEDANYEMARNLYTKSQLQALLNDAEDIGNKGGSGTGGGGFVGNPSTGSKPEKDNTDVIKDLIGEEDKLDAETPFTDVPTSHWAYSDIYFLKDLGAISGLSAEIFNPEGQVTREQFLKIVIDALKIAPATADVTFEDVVPGAWYESYVKTGVASGIINGIDSQTFGVGQNITRQDVCVILTRAMNLNTENVAELNFEDSSSVSPYANSAVSALVEYAIINGFTDNTFKPASPCTRAQSARIVANAIGILNAIENN